MKELASLIEPRLFSATRPCRRPQKPLTLFGSHQSKSPNSSMSNSKHSNSMKQQVNTENEPSMWDYPIPLSPPLPAISKDIELSRAMSASSNSSLFLLSKDDVIFEDQWLFVVNKPSGVYCETLLSSAPALIQQQQQQQQPFDSTEPLEFHLANRLDRDTSGVMVITKLHKAAGKLVKAFTDHKVQKTYIALCVGIAPKWSKVRLKSGHGRSKYGAWRVYSSSDVGRTLPGGSSVRDMETLFEVISINGEIPLEMTCEGKNNEENVVIVEEKSSIEVKHRDEIVVRAFPRSGRTHQIRLHCQYLGMPIKGDVKYEGVNEWKGEPCGGHTLHAESLSFEHPITGVPLKFQAPLPLWAAQAVSFSFHSNLV
ncbi:RNA pseudouridine synthase 1 [Silene latifolia]|uniref:RNA pseudouridine synthase 1 n=1 Tax=Silene latifolia TaxID=37657 RepID=UPI003D77063E